MLIIPNLYETPFRQVLASVSVPLVELSESEYENCVAFEGLTAKIGGDRPVFATLDMGSDQGEESDLQALLSLSFQESPPGHELAELAAQLGQEWDCSLMKWEQSDPESIWNPLTVFLQKRANIFLKASFTVDRNQLPSDSLVASMIGLRAKAGEEQFLLSGAQFTVRGFPDDTVSWYLEPWSGSEKVSGDLTRNWVENFHAESISDAIHVIEARFNRVIRAQSDVKTHA